MRRIKKFLRRYADQYVLFLYRNAQNKNIITKDIYRWKSIIPLLPQDGSPEQILTALFRSYPEFRNLFYFRLVTDPLLRHIIYKLAYSYVYPPKSDLSIGAKETIGPGLFIQHGRSSGMIVQSMGANCWINQHVSIGYRRQNERPPLIGDNVHISAGAKIYGEITVGDNVIVGANAVIIKDVPSNCTVVGVPGRIVKRNGIRVDEPL